MSPDSPSVDPDYTGREDRVFQAALLAPNLRFIRQVYGPEAEARLYKAWGITKEEAEDGTRWLTYDKALALNKAMVLVTGDSDVTHKAGLMHAETSEVGALFYVAKLLATPRAVYSRLPGWGKDLSKITAYELLEIHEGEARLEFRMKDGYPDHPLLDAKRRGTLAAIPMSFGLPPAVVVEEACMNRGDPTCIYRVTWQTPGAKYTIGALMMGLGAVAGFVLGLLIEGHPLWWAGAGLLGGLAVAAMRRGVRRLRLAQDKMRIQEGQIGTLEELAKEQRDQASRLEVLREISNLLHRLTGEDDLVLRATELVCKRLDFARVLYWKVEGERLVPASGAGLSNGIAGGMDKLWLPLNPELDGRPVDLPLFGLVLQTMKGRRVADVAAFRAKLTPRGQAMLDQLAPGPFVVVPVRSEGEGVGVLAAERVGGGTVSDADQSMLQQVANQLGLAMDNARMLDRLREQKKQLENELMLTEKFSHYLPHNVVQRLRDNPAERLVIDGKTIRATVLFSDIKGFTPWAEGRKSEEVVSHLNNYFREMDDIIARTGGILDKRMGDGLMVVFLHPPGGNTELCEEGREDPDAPRHPAERALEAAIAMQREARRQAALGSDSGFPGLPIRIGVAHGWLNAGNIGSIHRIEYTVIGDTVNVASRLEQLCEPGDVVTTRLTLHNAGASRFPATPMGLQKLKGRKEPVQASRLLTQEEIDAMEDTGASPLSPGGEGAP
jgi:class 3 adenylate cyclase